MNQAARSRRVGRYALYAQIGAGGMASVHLGRLHGPVGFTRLCAIKRLHPHVSRDPAFVTMFLDEARLAARIRHPNVVQTLDVVAEDRDLFLVMEYIEGESLARLLALVGERDEKAPPAAIAASIVHGVLAGLAAAHEAKDERGRELGVVHRDVSPHNILVGSDGVPRVLDFGIAKAMGRLSTTQVGQLKGKVPYMAPEQIRSRPVSARTDVWGTSVVLWETLTGSRLFTGSEREIISKIFEAEIPPPSSVEPSVPPELDAIVKKGLQLDPDARHASAREMAIAIARAIGIVPASEISSWVIEIAGEALARRAELVRDAEASAPREISMLSSDSEPTRIKAKPAPSRSGRGLFLLLAGIVIGAAVVGVAAISRRSSAPPAAAELTESAAPAPQPPAVAESTPAPEPSVFELPPDWTPEASAKPAKPVRSVATAAPSRAQDKTVSECEPPYYYEKGIKKYKSQCLRR